MSSKSPSSAPALPTEFSHPALQAIIKKGRTSGVVDGATVGAAIAESGIKAARAKVVLRALADQGIEVSVPAPAKKAAVRASAKVASATKATATKAAPAKTPTTKTTTTKTTTTKATPNKATPTKATPAKATPAKATTTKAPATKAAPAKATTTKATTTNATAAKAAVSKAATTKAAATKAAPSASPAPPPSAPAKRAAKKAPAKKAAAGAVDATDGPEGEEVSEADLARIEADGTAQVAVVNAEADADSDLDDDDETPKAAKADEENESAGFVIRDDEEDAPAQQVVTAGATADPVKDYLKQIGKVALLNAEQEVDLAKRIEAGLFAEERLNSGDKLEMKMKRELWWIA
ncbi:MAG: sigma-70 factor domain-containing protein, partial [Nostocoides sp.]